METFTNLEVRGMRRHRMRCGVFAATLLATPSFGQSAPRTHTLVGAGDIARCDSNADEATARLIGNMRGTVFTLGDNVQGSGAASEFRNCYAPSWGRFKNRTRPAVGNHEYYTPGARPYYGYFGVRAGVSGRGYYSYKRGNWLIVVLNSNCDVIRCDRNSAQVAWLRQTLAANPTRCTAAMFHHPLFSTNSPTPNVRTLWRVLYNRKADIILNGHAHSYERFAPQNPDGVRDLDRGIRQFVVGTGGAEPINPFGPRPKNSVVRNDQTNGVMRLTLRNGSYNWKFVPVAGKTFTDSGGARCR
ncbi:MAG: metallophosphoesterase family protein [Rubrobacteraceae bacterium]